MLSQSAELEKRAAELQEAKAELQHARETSRWQLGLLEHLRATKPTRQEEPSEPVPRYEERADFYDSSPLPDKSFFMTLIGSAGSGKTSLMVNMLRSPQMYFQAFKHVHLVMPPHSLASLDVKIFKKRDKTYPDLDWATLDKIHEKTREAADEEEFSLLIRLSAM
eukprot:jgi/Tetstr1/441417/TSEL_029663.t1